MKKQIMAAFVASLIVISGAQAGIPVEPPRVSWRVFYL